MNTSQRIGGAAAAAALFLTAAASASALGRLSLGVKGGFNSANIRIETETNITTYQAVSRLAWGGFIGYRISDNIGIQVEVLDFPKGTQIPESFMGASFIETLRYDYTEVPLLVRFSEKTRSPLTPSLFAGPYIAFLRKAESSLNGFEGSDTLPIADRRDTDFGLVFGASLAYKLGPASLLGEIRYDLGLANVDKTPGSTFNHRVISLLVGVGL